MGLDALLPAGRRARSLTVYGAGDDLVICCSAANRRQGSFDFYKALAGLNARRIYINTPENSFYHRGAYGCGDTIKATAATLKAKIAVESPRRVHLVGASMGGYAALLFGALLRADAVIAFNSGYQLPVAVLGQEVINRGMHDARYVDLLPFIQRASATRFYLANSDHFPRDLHQAIGLSRLPNVRVLLHRGTHNLLDVLKHIDLESAVRLLINGEDDEFLSRVGGRAMPALPESYSGRVAETLAGTFDAGKTPPGWVIAAFHSALPLPPSTPRSASVDESIFD